MCDDSYALRKISASVSRLPGYGIALTDGGGREAPLARER